IARSKPASTGRGSSMRVDLVTVPYRYDERGEGLGAGPDALLAAGLPDQLRAAGIRLAGPHEAHLDPALQVEGRTALNIGRLGADTARLVAAARRNGDGALVLVGDDTAAIGVVSGLEQAASPATAIGVVWVDAHGDFNTPETSFSGILAGMPVAILAGLAGPLWRNEAGLATPVATENIILAGVRELDEKEEVLIRSTDVQVVPATDLCDGDVFAQAVDRLARRCALLYLHVDLDVLDPRFVPSASTPSANGLSIEELVAAMATVLQSGKVAAVTISSLNPGAGARGERSVASAMKTIEGALPAWTAAPGPSASGNAS
ncbi:MAG: Arginase/agmatinase/formiminoglutamase, partial [Thermomicrobiales bacterium]|nr:Arginase/agmatinase/formiminoglutamase [Thermomicrobiales bacterium]